MKDLKTRNQLNEASENLNISDVSDSYYIVLYFNNSEKRWTQSTREVFKNIDDVINFIGDMDGLKIFKMIQ